MPRSHGPPKFWDYDRLIGDLNAAILEHVEACAGESWERIFFSLRNQAQYPYEIRVVFRERPEEHVEPTAEIDQIVQRIVKLLRKRPTDTWETLSVEYYSDPLGSVIELR